GLRLDRLQGNRDTPLQSKLRARYRGYGLPSVQSVSVPRRVLVAESLQSERLPARADRRACHPFSGLGRRGLPARIEGIPELQVVADLFADLCLTGNEEVWRKRTEVSQEPSEF